MKRLLEFAIILAVIWGAVYLIEPKRPACHMAPVIWRTIGENLGEPYYTLELDILGEPETIAGISADAFKRAQSGEILACQDTGFVTRVKSGWYVR